MMSITPSLRISRSASAADASPWLQPRLKAVAELRRQHSNDQDAVAWLQSAQSRYASDSSGEICVVAALKDCSYEEVLSLLETAAALEVAGTSYDNLDSLFSDYAARSAVNTYGTPPPFDHASKANAPYHCTQCGPKRTFKNLGDWKRHERVHEMPYVCMLNGATTEGDECVFCGLSGPDNEHFSIHNIQQRTEQCPFSFFHEKRANVVKHMEDQHNSTHSTEEMRKIADGWRLKEEKQAWGCGFCSCSLAKFNDRLNHIGTELLERRPGSDEWKTTNVIQGLLRQPMMGTAWNDLVEFIHGGDRPDFSWEGASVTGLQRMLEFGPSATQLPEYLAKEAYAHATPQCDTERGPADLSFAPGMDDGGLHTTRPTPQGPRPGSDIIYDQSGTRSPIVAFDHQAFDSQMDMSADDNPPTTLPTSFFEEWLNDN